MGSTYITTNWCNRVCPKEIPMTCAAGTAKHQLQWSTQGQAYRLDTMYNGHLNGVYDNKLPYSPFECFDGISFAYNPWMSMVQLGQCCVQIEFLFPLGDLLIRCRSLQGAFHSRQQSLSSGGRALKACTDRQIFCCKLAIGLSPGRQAHTTK